jgi:SHS2 domain-containing protein
VTQQQRFEILEHTADIGVRAFGSTLAELFENAALGVQSLALDDSNVESREAYPISANGEDPESLMVNWLNEVIYFLDGRKVVMASLEIDNCTGTAISGKAHGEPRDVLRHPPSLVVKAATYHQLRIDRAEDGYIAEVYLDI